MKILGFIGLLIGGLLVYGYFFDHTFLRNAGLGGLISAEANKADDERAAQIREAAIEANRSTDGSGLVKCVDANGNITFTQGACAGGSSGHAVKLHETQILHIAGNNGQNGQNGDGSTHQQSQTSSGSGQSLIVAPEGHKENAQGALHDKYLPQ